MSARRRFYQQVGVVEAAGGFELTLDARALKTPAGAAFFAPTRALADACAGEWEAQGEHIVPAQMPLTQLAFAAIDLTPNRREQLARSLAKYIEADLVCHRAAAPAALVARQALTWDPIVEWARVRFHIAIPVATGIIAAASTPQTRTLLESEIDDLDPLRCTALAQATTLAGSVLIGFALLEKRLDAEAAFAAAALDELWSLQHWGEDAEARERLEELRQELDAVARFVQALSA